MEKLKVLELFGGIGACSKALERLGIDFEIADYVEIDKYAVASFNAIHNTNFEPQDICKWDKDIEVDLIMHGSPCQDFSLAGKQAGGDKDSGTRSSLMYETLRIVEKLQPKYVIWENVKNLLSKNHKHNFDAYLESMEKLGYTNFYQVLNAKDYGIPQNRERVFTVSIRRDIYYKQGDYWFPKGNENDNKIDRMYGMYGQTTRWGVYNENGLAPTITAAMGMGGGHVPMIEEKKFEFPPKQELKLKLKDMLEDNVDEKYYLSGKQIESIKYSSYVSNQRRIQEKDYCDTLCARDWKDPKCVQVATLPYYNYESDGRVYSPSGLSPCLRSKELNQKIDENDKILIKNATKQGYLEATDGDGINISSRMQYHRGNVQKESIQTITTSGGNDRGVVENLRIRKLTPKECWRLMGFDDEDFEKAEKVNSNTQLYKQAGNSIVVNVLYAILKNLLVKEKWSDLD